MHVYLALHLSTERTYRQRSTKYSELKAVISDNEESWGIQSSLDFIVFTDFINMVKLIVHSIYSGFITFTEDISVFTLTFC
jgi:hypothetical protein